MGLLDKFRRGFASGGAKPPLTPADGGGWRTWIPIVREPYTGAWQQNAEIYNVTILQNETVFACVTLIAGDVSKLKVQLVALNADGVWEPATNPAYSPVLRRPNRYQTQQQFIEQWITSKELHGNTYVLKARDARGVVNGLYVLDPWKVRVLVAPDGAVYYSLYTDWLVGIDSSNIAAPASEIIHDRFNCLWHPLQGVSPLYAANTAASIGSDILNNSSAFFKSGSNPGGVLSAPGAISDDTAKRLKDYWDANFSGSNAGKVAVVGDGLTYTGMRMSAVDSQLIEQTKATKEAICEAFHVPPYMLGLGAHPPHYANVEPLLQQYYAQCIQTLLTALESTLDAGLEMDPAAWGVECDIDDLIWMDTTTRTKAAADAIGSGAMTPNEARGKYFGLGPVEGGDTPYMQQQYYALSALAARDAMQPFAVPASAPPPDQFVKAFAASLRRKVPEVLYAA